MSIAFVVSPRARVDAFEIAEFVDIDNPAAAVKLSKAIFDTFDFIAENPLAGPLYHSKNRSITGIRRCVVKNYRNYLVFYREHNHTLTILRVIHGARNIDLALRED